MLKNSLKRRIFLIISTLFIILIIYIYPTSQITPSIKNLKIDNNNSPIYLIDSNNYLARVLVYIDKEDPIEKIKEIIEYLTIDSSKSHYLKEGFTGTLPNNTKLLSININKDIATLNFNDKLLLDNEDIVSSLIYSITSIKGINKISIYINGNIPSNIPSVLDRSYGINKEYNVSNFKNINQTTIYYLAKNNEYYYYVPVTIINNDNTDKLEIIINELTSKVSYQTGLISYLKASREINYQYIDDIMEINIKKELFNSLNNSNLLEKVIYSINLSIEDNYNVKSIIYLVDNSIYSIYYI